MLLSPFYAIGLYESTIFILRNHGFRYELINSLNQQELPFMIPSFESTLFGLPYLMLSNGTFGRVSHYIHGNVPTIRNAHHIFEIGKTCGLLIDALSKVNMSLPAPLVPFYDIYRLHPLVSKSTVESFIKSPPFTCDRTEMDFIINSINEMDTLLAPFSNLPMQVIHRDLLLTNFLIDEDDKITGILDFDFAS